MKKQFSIIALFLAAHGVFSSAVSAAPSESEATCRERVYKECIGSGGARDYCADVAHDVCDDPS